MSDLKDRHFIRNDVRDMVRVTIPALQKKINELQGRVTALEVDVIVDEIVADVINSKNSKKNSRKKKK